MKAVLSRPERPIPRPRGLESGACSKAHHMRHPNQLAPLGAFFHLAGNQFRSSLPLKSFPASATHLNPVSNMSCQRREVQVEAVTGEKGDAERLPGSVAGSESLSVPGVVCVDPHGGLESVSCRGRWPARATAPVERSAAWCAVHPAADAGAGDGRRSARVGSARAPQREPERLVMVACREPCDLWGLGRVQPFGQREIRTMAIWREGVFRRERGVLRLDVNVGRQAGPRNVWICSAWPCLPSPTKAWMSASVTPKDGHCWLGQA